LPDRRPLLVQGVTTTKRVITGIYLSAATLMASVRLVSAAQKWRTL